MCQPNDIIYISDDEEAVQSDSGETPANSSEPPTVNPNTGFFNVRIAYALLGLMDNAIQRVNSEAVYTPPPPSPSYSPVPDESNPLYEEGSVTDSGSEMGGDDDELDQRILQAVLDEMEIDMQDDGVPLTIHVPVDPDDRLTECSASQCMMCVEREVRVAFFCGHIPCCGTCVGKMIIASNGIGVKCPFCRCQCGFIKLNLPWHTCNGC